MSNNDVQWFWAVIILPIIIGIFKKEISSFFNDLSVYRSRRFDDNKTPGFGQECFIQSKATGKFIKIYIYDYEFGVFPSNRLVITHQDDPDGDTNSCIIVPYTYVEWRSMVKGSLPLKRDKLKNN